MHLKIVFGHLQHNIHTEDLAAHTRSILQLDKQKTIWQFYAETQMYVAL